LPPADRVVVDWRISEYKPVGDNEVSHADKLVVLFSCKDYCAAIRMQSKCSRSKII